MIEELISNEYDPIYDYLSFKTSDTEICALLWYGRRRDGISIIFDPTTESWIGGFILPGEEWFL